MCNHQRAGVDKKELWPDARQATACDHLLHQPTHQFMMQFHCMTIALMQEKQPRAKGHRLITEKKSWRMGREQTGGDERQHLIVETIFETRMVRLGWPSRTAAGEQYLHPQCASWQTQIKVLVSAVIRTWGKELQLVVCSVCV